jgi:benzoyl-CoA reductase subunit C
MANEVSSVAAIETFRDVLKDRHGTARQWKAQGGKVVGHRCLFVPEEIIWAAGLLPYPLFGTPEPIRLADSYFQSCTCECVRNIFDQALDGELAFLDFLALSNTCDVSRRLYDNWNHYIETCPVYVLNNPQKLLQESSREYFTEELRRFQAAMEELSGKPVTDERLRDAITLYNETRDLLREIYELRKRKHPSISGAEALDVCMATSLMPKDRANPLLRQLLAQLREHEAALAAGPRILVTGSILDSPALLRMIEEEGGRVVVEDLCTTTRMFWGRVENSGDPIEALYRFLNQRVFCACLHPAQARVEHVLGLVDAFGVEAVIDLNLKYCHPFLYEAPLLLDALEQKGVPAIALEIGHDMSGHGQLRTRIQAFIEMLEL